MTVFQSRTHNELLDRLGAEIAHAERTAEHAPTVESALAWLKLASELRAERARAIRETE